MKTQRAHRRKLRFNSTKDVAPVVTVKVESALKRPIKRRKRQQRSRRVSPVPARLGSSTRGTNGLAEATWSDIQERFAAVKSLGEITRIMLQFFKEHENLQGSASGPVFPIFVPSSEIYKMKVPRKRRIYDVLHVLEGIGVIKRVRCDEMRRTKGGYFLYFGKAAVVQRLADMKSNSAHVMVEFRQSRRSKVTSIVEEDSALVKVFEAQAAVEKWPCLVTTTVSFLGLLFQQDYQVGVTLPAVSGRLIEAKKFIGALEPSSPYIETPYSDVHRRVYDVMSVLVSCNMIDTSLEPSSEPSDKSYPRKHVRFNYDIFTDPRVLFAVQDCGARWNDYPSCESMFGATGSSLCGFKSPTSKALEDHLISPPLAYWQSLHTGTMLAVSPIFSLGPVRMSDASNCEKTNWEPLPYDGSKKMVLRSGASSYVQSGTFVRCRPEGQPAARVQDLFSPLGREPTERNEWYDESLNQLGFYTALPREDNIDWNLSKPFKDCYREIWGSHDVDATTSYAPVQVLPHHFEVDRVEVKSADLACHEVLLVDGVSGNTANFFC